MRHHRFKLLKSSILCVVGRGCGGRGRGRGGRFDNSQGRGRFGDRIGRGAGPEGRGQGRGTRGRGRGDGAFGLPVRPRPPTLLQKLLAKDVRRGRSHLLQGFRFVRIPLNITATYYELCEGLL